MNNNQEIIRITELAKLDDEERRDNMIYLSSIQEPVQVTERAKQTRISEMPRSIWPPKTPNKFRETEIVRPTSARTKVKQKQKLTLAQRREKASDSLMRTTPIFIVCLVMLIVSLVATLKITWTGLELWGISFDIVSMNDDSEIHHWNDHIQEIYEEDIAKRNALINSEDDLVSFVARHSNLVRLPIWAATIMLLLMSIFSIKVLLPKVVRPAYFLFKTRKHAK